MQRQPSEYCCLLHSQIGALRRECGGRKLGHNDLRLEDWAPVENNQLYEYITHRVEPSEDPR